MVKKKAIVLDANADTLHQMKEYFDETGVLELVHIGDDGELGIEKALALKPESLLFICLVFWGDFAD